MHFFIAKVMVACSEVRRPCKGNLLALQLVLLLMRWRCLLMRNCVSIDIMSDKYHGR